MSGALLLRSEYVHASSAAASLGLRPQYGLRARPWGRRRGLEFAELAQLVVIVVEVWEFEV